jgi:hypothetical protein
LLTLPFDFAFEFELSWLTFALPMTTLLLLLISVKGAMVIVFGVVYGATDYCDDKNEMYRSHLTVFRFSEDSSL